MTETRGTLTDLQKFEELTVNVGSYSSGLSVVNSKILVNRKLKILIINLHITCDSPYPQVAKWGKINGITLPTTHNASAVIKISDSQNEPYYVSVLSNGEIVQNISNYVRAIWVNGIIKY